MAEDDMPLDAEVVAESIIDLSDVVPVEHQHDHIVGNELRCSLHDGTCPVILVSPTTVLEKGADGTLRLVDRAVA